MILTVESIKGNPELLKTLEKNEKCSFCKENNVDIGHDKFSIDNTICCSDCFYDKFSEIVESNFTQNIE